jgi:hypothetical protein
LPLTVRETEFRGTGVPKPEFGNEWQRGVHLIPELAMKLELDPVGEGDDDAYWVLELTAKRVRLYDDRDENVGSWSARNGVDRFLMPSFWGSRKSFGIYLGGDETIEFKPHSVKLKKIKDYADRIHVRKYPNAPSRALAIGGSMAAGGLLMMLVAIAVWIWTYERAANNPGGGRYLVWTGGILVGLSIACRGVYKLFEFSKWKRLLREAEEEDE